MEFKKVTITLPKPLYDEGMKLVKHGLFSNFSDIVRSGIRSEMKSLEPIADYFFDDTLSAEEIALLQKSYDNEKSGKLMPVDKMRKELNL
ncbi:hypothetical protein COY95_02005 [Candidatus Woesearchaeota archaeon CG_4_10_14_0_8_um_filter_47_5]|nr:MAG: hypothetical protein COY95_02005 [Candidatus Woesearchaeota archaeon CG_4_10_14_0_8_um_filter_47_5]